MCISLRKTLILTNAAYVRTFQLKPHVCRISSFIYRCTIIARTLSPSDAHPRKRVDVSENAWPPEFAKSIKLHLHSFHFARRHSKDQMRLSKINTKDSVRSLLIKLTE